MGTHSLVTLLGLDLIHGLHLFVPQLLSTPTLRYIIVELDISFTLC